MNGLYKTVLFGLGLITSAFLACSPSPTIDDERSGFAEAAEMDSVYIASKTKYFTVEEGTIEGNGVTDWKAIISSSQFIMFGERHGSVATGELTEALIVKPHESQNIVETLKMALEMNASEQRWRLKKMQEGLKKYNVKNWAESFIKNLMDLNKLQQNSEVHLLSSDTALPILEG